MHSTRTSLELYTVDRRTYTSSTSSAHVWAAGCVQDGKPRYHLPPWPAGTMSSTPRRPGPAQNGLMTNRIIVAGVALLFYLGR